MTLKEMLGAANTRYPDGWLAEYFHPKTGKPRRAQGDTLAKFIVIEVAETFDPGATDAEQIDEAVRVLERAIQDLEGTIEGIEELGAVRAERRPNPKMPRRIRP